MTQEHTSLLERKVAGYLDGYLAPDEFRSFLSKRIRWAVQGFTPGFDMDDRERFTRTVERRLFWRSRRWIEWGAVRFRWFRTAADCAADAEVIVTEFLRDSRIKFGDPDFWWADGHDIADEVMSYYEH